MACILIIQSSESTTLGEKRMHPGIYISLSGAKLQELRLDLAANNLANANTAGFKSEKISSRSFVFDLQRATAGQMPSEDTAPPDNDLTPYRGTYTKTAFVGTDFSQGDHKFTGNPFNISLNGPGFIAVETPQGTRYTRHGCFQLNSDGELVTSEGHLVKGRGLSDLGEGLFSVDTKGNVLIDGERTGEIEIVEFENPKTALRKQGHTLFAPTGGGSPQDADNTVVKQGYEELPNISVVTEMVNLIELNRLYEAYQKSITTIDESTQKIINDVAD
jgi:flagellar basal-body rod protein FlgG